jgi:C4-dicarboxylate-specific signal transduction histidine kinase
MSNSNPLLWRKPPLRWSIGIAVVSVAAALLISRLPSFHLQSAPVSLFLCAVMISAWFGGLWPGLLAIVLSCLAFIYYFLAPLYSFAVNVDEIPRGVLFLLSALFVGSLTAAQRNATESLISTRDELKEAVQELETANKALLAESSERKLAEEALRQAQADLARVSRVTTMGELTASLAHEVNQPIAAAVTDAKTCIRWLMRAQPDLEEAREAASRTMKDAIRAGEITNRIRLLFKKGTPQWELVDMNEVVLEMTALLRDEAARHSVSLQTELASYLPKVKGDRIQLQQVMMNLMINSIDAMKDVDTTRELTIKSRRSEDEQLVVSVSDTGVGLPPQQADRIFDPFFTTKLDGTGMGLRISRSIIESHGGRLWAADQSPRGASFYFTLPTIIEVNA